MEEKKKVFITPIAEIVDFGKYDVIRTSGEGLTEGTDDAGWNPGGSETEGF